MECKPLGKNYSGSTLLRCGWGFEGFPRLVNWTGVVPAAAVHWEGASDILNSTPVRFGVIAAVVAVAAAPAFQPGPGMLRGVFEEALSRRQEQFGVFDARTAQAARDLGM